ncbi:MAG: cyclic nucleotide-binding domain-containing protein [Candidatus Edwardsbacteria bacterium]
MEITKNFWERLKERLDFSQYKPKPIDFCEKRGFNLGEEREYHILKNSQEGTYLRLSGRDFYLFSLMDGIRTVQEILVDYFRKFGTFAFSRLGTLIEELREHFLLTERPQWLYSKIKEKLTTKSLNYKLNELRAHFLQYEFAIKGIDGFLSRVYQRFFWIFFTKPAKIFYIIISSTGFLLFLHQVSLSKYSLLKTGESYTLGIITLILINALALLVHEAAHAFSCKSYGRSVNRAGFMIYRGMPAFFVDTMDIWMEPKKARMVVSWAGPYSQAILAGLASLVVFFYSNFLLTPFLFKFSFLCYLSIFFNLNPLLELDGYFLLMDYLEIPLLRKKSLNFVRRDFLKKIKKREKFSREEIIFTIFGILIGLWSAWAIFTASYFWRKGASKIAHSTIVQTVMAGNLPIAIIVVLGVLLLFLVKLNRLFKITSKIFHFLLKQGLLEKKLNLALLFLLFSIFLTLLSPGLPHLSVQILRLCALIFALGFILKTTSYYSGSRFKLVFQVLSGFIFLLLLSDILGLFQTFDLILPFGSYLHYLAYLLLFLAAFLLFTQSQAMHWSPLEKGLFGVSLAFSFLITFPAISWAMKANWSFLEIAVVSVVLFIGGLSMILTLPTLFAYQHTEFEIFWLLLFGAMASLVSGDLIHIFEHTHLLGFSLSSAFFLFSQSLLAGSFSLFYLIQHSITWTREEASAEVSLSDKTRLKRAGAKLYRSLFEPFRYFYGKILAKNLEERINLYSLATNWCLWVHSGKLEERFEKDASILHLAEIYQKFFNQSLLSLQQLGGAYFVRKSLISAYEDLYWLEREIAWDYLFKETVWGKDLETRMTFVKRAPTDFIASVSLFAGMTVEEKQMIQARLKEERHKKGEVIVNQGEIGDKFYIVKSGEVTVSVKDKLGLEQPVATLGPGDYFGEIALIKKIPRTATVTAKSEVSLFTLGRADFERLLISKVDLGEKIDRLIQNRSFLMKIPLFSELSPSQMALLASQFSYEKHRAGEEIVREGEAGDAFYVIKSGQLEVWVKNEQGEEKKVARLGEGEYFGEIALLLDVPRTATVKTVTETELLKLKKEDFKELLGEHLYLAKNLEQISSRRIYDTKRKTRAGEKI